jgi:hypothetical protein
VRAAAKQLDTPAAEPPPEYTESANEYIESNQYSLASGQS